MQNSLGVRSNTLLSLNRTSFNGFLLVRRLALRMMTRIFGRSMNYRRQASPLSCPWNHERFSGYCNLEGYAMTENNQAPVRSAENALVEVRDPQPRGMVQQWRDRGQDMATSLDLAKPETTTDYVKMMAKADRLAKQCVGQELIVTHWLLHVATLTDAITGEVADTLRLVLMLRDGTTVSTTAPGIISRWYDVARGFTKGNQFSSVAITIRAHPGKRAGEWLEIASAKLATKGK